MKIHKILCLTAILLSGWLNCSFAQNHDNDQLDFYIANNLYVSNEDIEFSIHLSNLSNSDEDYLNILLLNKEGAVADSYLFLMNENILSDRLSIKKELGTGYYKLVAFVKSTSGETYYNTKNLFILNEEDQRTTYSQIFDQQLNINILPEGGRAFRHQENTFKVSINMPHRVENLLLIDSLGKILRSIDNYNSGSAIFSTDKYNSEVKIVSRDTTYSIPLQKFYSTGLKLTFDHEDQNSIKFELAGDKISTHEVEFSLTHNNRNIHQEVIEIDSSNFLKIREFYKKDLPEGRLTAHLKSAGHPISFVETYNSKPKLNDKAIIEFNTNSFNINQQYNGQLMAPLNYQKNEIRFVNVFIHNVDEKINSESTQPFYSESLDNEQNISLESILDKVEASGSKLEGRAWYVSDSTPVRNSKLTFYFLLNGNIQSMNSDEDGYFSDNAAILYGNSKVFVIGERDKSLVEEVFIEISDRFADINFPKEFIPSFYFTQDKFDKLKLLQQIRNTYNEEKKVPANYFTTTEKEIFLKDFYKLPNMEEVIREIVPNTYVKKVNGQDEIRLRNPDLTSFSGSPLFIVDGIPWLESSDILDLPTEAVNSIISINQGPTKYAFGPLGRNGIIIIDLYDNHEFNPSRKINFPNVQGFTNTISDGRGKCSFHDSEPDINKVLYNKSIKDKLTFEFCTNDLKGNYKTHILMVMRDGKVIKEDIYFKISQ